MIVSSPHNERLRWVRRLAADRKARRREGVWVAEGLRLAEEVLAAGLPVRLWVLEEGWGDGGQEREEDLRGRVESRGDPILTVKRGVLREVADTQSPQGIVAAFDAPAWRLEHVLAGAGPVVVLDRLQDPGNLGTIARSAEGAGAAGVLLTPGCADPGNPKALRASAGALLRLPAARAEDPVPLLRRAGRTLCATAGAGGTAYDEADLSRPLALLFGQEGGGLSTDLVRAADLLLTVPMAGRLESLNVASTAAVLLFEAARQRRRGA